jgi:hypothetical protein
VSIEVFNQRIITGALRQENSKAQRQKIVDCVGKDTTMVAALIGVFLSGDYTLVQRAAEPLAMIARAHPTLIKPYLKRIIQNLKQPNLNDAVTRNTLRLLQEVEIPASLHGDVTQLCFHYLTDVKAAIAIKVFAMTVLANITSKHPELKNEMKLIIEDQLPYGSAGFVSRGRKVIKQLSK